MNAETIIIYRQAHKYKGREFTTWSYLDDPDPNKSTMRFAFSLEGETVAELPDRAEAVRKARQRIDELPAKPVEETPASDPPQAKPRPARTAAGGCRPTAGRGTRPARATQPVRVTSNSKI